MKPLKKVIFTGILTTAAIFCLTICVKAATVEVTGDTLNIRKGPSTSSNIVATISKGVKCELIGEEGDWYQIKYKNYSGYISKQYAKLIDTKQESSGAQTENQTKPNEQETSQEDNIIYKKFTKDAEIKILPLIHASKIGEMKKDNQVILLSQTAAWSYIQADTISGWVRSDCLTDGKKPATTTNNNQTTSNNNTSTTGSTEKIAYVNEEYVNIRKGAGTNYAVIKVLTLNAQVTILKEEGSWYKVKSGSDTGYISKEFVSDTKKATTRGLSAARNDTVEEQSNTKKETSSDDTQKVENKQTNTNVVGNQTKGTDIIAYAKKYMGHKYVYGGDGSNGTFDCSGFTMYVYKHFGISLPHGATSQYKSGKGTKISKQSSLQTGDIVFLTDYSTGKGIGHCGIYIGNGNFIHASTTTYTVTISSLNTTYAGRFYAGLRLI
ncbi:MAG: SH3 domain-containing protein [Clostridia bacterium]|jgi:cell wall-associated NlpC family hydrolase|nr:SH3 domain-containing protein [Clostridia bacterium]